MTTYIGNAYDNNTNPIGLCLGQISPCAKDASACVADFGGVYLWKQCWALRFKFRFLYSK